LSIGLDTTFVIGSSDGCLANLGSFATSPGVAALTIGTSGAIRVASDQPTHNFHAMTFNYRLDENTFISGGPINNGGVVLKWFMQTFLKKELLTPADYQQIIHEIQDVNAGADGLIFLPYLLGERAPLWSSDACGVFFGIRAHHTQAHFTRAVVEGICLALYHIAQRLEESGLDIKRVHVSGGFVHSEEWLQVLADIFGKPIILIHPEDASALGAAYLALKKLGYVTSYDALLPGTQKSFLPREERHRHYQEEVFPLFKNLSLSLMLDMAIANQHD
jgi:gluconokinase